MYNRNHSKLNHSLKMTLLSLLAINLLAGCGIRGSLKTPPPLFGGQSKVDPSRVPTEDLDQQDDELELELLGDGVFDAEEEDGTDNPEVDE